MKSQCLNSSKVLILLDLPLVLYSTEIKVLHALKPCKRHAQTYPRNDKLMLPELKKKKPDHYSILQRVISKCIFWDVGSIFEAYQT